MNSASAASTIWLASRSPRRRQLLIEAGVDVRIMPPDIDDARLRHGEVPPEWWVMALAYLKARRVGELLVRAGDRRQVSGDREAAIVLGADTVCAIGREIFGQPRDAVDARRMLRMMSGREHRTITGVCLLPVGGVRSQVSGVWEDKRTPSLSPDTCHLTPSYRLIVFDAAIVRIGELSDDQIEAYLTSGEWRGKAGAYNLSERIDAGWPITCLGDPSTVMGLPMQRLAAWLAKARKDFRF
jgi:septum formation protein